MKPTQLFIIFCLGLTIIGFLAVIFAYYLALERQKDLTLPEIKKRILQQGLKDSQGNPLVSPDESAQYLLVNKRDYQIIYQKNGDFFKILINNSPFEEIRNRAERHFLFLAQSSPEIICQLNVKVISAKWTNPELAGKTFPLSFCQK